MAFFLRSLGFLWILYLWKSNFFVQCHWSKLNQRYWPYSCWVYNCDYTSASSLCVSFGWFYCSGQQCNSCYSRNASNATWSNRSVALFLFDTWCFFSNQGFSHDQIRLHRAQCVNSTDHLKSRPNDLQHFNATCSNIAGCNMLCMFDHPFATCWTLLAWVKLGQIWATNTQHFATHRNTS